jgi:hypothetical protein
MLALSDGVTHLIWAMLGWLFTIFVAIPTFWDWKFGRKRKDE